MKWEVFIAYDTDTGKPIAIHLRDSLLKREISAFVACKDIGEGEHWKEKRDEALDGCRYFIVLGTDPFLISPEVKKEIRRAEDGNKIILPYHVKEVDRIEFLRLFQGGQRQDLSFENKEELTITVLAFLKGEREKALAPAPPVPWYSRPIDTSWLR